jgi:sugar (pentulose or hexulose) kinase
LFQGPAHQPGNFWQMAFGDVSARYLHWYRDQLPDRPDFDSLLALAAQAEPGAGGLTLAIDAPLTTMDAVFRGLSPQHTRGQAVRCILESVAWALRDQVQVVSPDGLPEEVRSAGGASRGTVWLKIKADILGVPFRAIQCPEPTSLGAAILAESALTADPVPAVAARWVQPGAVFRPDLERHQGYVALRHDAHDA